MTCDTADYETNLLKSMGIDHGGYEYIVTHNACRYIWDIATGVLLKRAIIRSLSFSCASDINKRSTRAIYTSSCSQLQVTLVNTLLTPTPSNDAKRSLQYWNARAGKICGHKKISCHKHSILNIFGKSPFKENIKWRWDPNGSIWR